MAEAHPFIPLFQTLLSVVLMLVQVFIAAAALIRFRATGAGLVISGSNLVFAFMTLVAMIVMRMMYARMDPWDPVVTMTNAGFGLLDMLFTLILGVGIALIPSSLSKLAAKS